MYCTDCHGSNTAVATVVPTGNNPWGPHGSTNNFILKGTWTSTTGTGQQANGLCFRCHDYNLYATDNNLDANSGFCCDSKNNLHAEHVKRIGRNRIRCTWCHAAVPHGWKNKALLVNLNDVGVECDTFTGEVCRGGNGWGGTNGGCSIDNGFSCGPYYQNAFLKVRNFKTSGNWLVNDCGSATNPSGGDGFGIKWMKDETCPDPN